MATYTLDYGNGHTRTIRALSDEIAEGFAASERAILRNPDVAIVACSREDDPSQHVSPFVRRAMAGTLPPKVLA